MGLANVEIARFQGRVEQADKVESETYLVAVNGVYPMRYGSPRFSFPPKEWIEQYTVAKYRVGNFPDWRSFYRECSSIVERENPFKTKVPSEVIKSYLTQYNLVPTDKNQNDDVDIDSIIEELT
jgi:hypothetical protein